MSAKCIPYKYYWFLKYSSASFAPHVFQAAHNLSSIHPFIFCGLITTPFEKVTIDGFPVKCDDRVNLEPSVKQEKAKVKHVFSGLLI